MVLSETVLHGGMGGDTYVKNFIIFFLQGYVVCLGGYISVL